MNQLTQCNRLRTTDFDRYGRLLPNTVLDLFQDAAAAHAEQLGLGFDAMQQRGLLWVVLRIYYEQLAQPRFSDEVTVQTWPHPAGMLDFGRDYVLRDADGRELVRGTSQWAVIRAETRKLATNKEVLFPVEGTREERLFPQRLRKLPDFVPTEPEQAIRSAFADVDRNGHVNNARYAGYVYNALRPDPALQLRSFQLDYHCEVLPEAALTLHAGWTGDEARCKGCDAAGTLMFNSRTTFERMEG